MSGISQPYISKFLNGNYKELSQRVRTILFAWFINARQKPELLLQTPAQRGVEPNQLDIFPQRRERYVFRSALNFS